jgi:2-iminobutanoate/2-iminopropanoate deaminase
VRRSIDVEGISHGSMPIPAASRVGPFVFSGGVSGTGADEAATPEAELTAQVRRMFANMAAIVTAAGGGTGDIAKVTVFARDRGYRDAINAEWVAMFPDPASRPARHTLVYDLPGRMLVQLEFVAVLEGEGGTAS